MTSYTWTGNVSDQWATPGNWSPSGPPGQNDTANISYDGGVIVYANGNDGNVTVEGLVLTEGLDGVEFALENDEFFTVYANNVSASSSLSSDTSIVVDSGSTLEIEWNDGGTFTNAGVISVLSGGSLAWAFTGSFANQHTILLGHVTGNNPANTDLTIAGTVTLTGGGTLDLGEQSDQFQTFSTATIENYSATNDALINVNNTITGGGSIIVSRFDNQAEGLVEASQEEGNSLQVYAATFTNEGTMIASTRATLDLGKDGTTGSLANTGEIGLLSDGDLAISGNFSISGSGVTEMKGAGSAVTSDEEGPTTFTNESEIADFSTGEIGDPLFYGANTNDLTFLNEGLTVVDGSGTQLTLDTGSNTITDNMGGSLLAENGGLLIIDSSVETGSDSLFEPGGTIEATSYGKVVINDDVSPAFLDQSGSIMISGYGTVSIGGGGAVISSPIFFSGAGGILQVTNASDDISGQITLAAGDFLDLTAMPFAGVTTNWTEIGDTVGTLTVRNGAATETFNINGDYSNSSFEVFNDGNGGTEIGLTNAAPPSGNTAVMIMSNLQNGDYEIYDVGGNTIESAYTLGQIATGWNFVGLGTLQAGDSNDMLFRDGANFEAYYVNSNAITSSALVGSVGTNWNFSGLGNFDGASSLSEMLLRNSSSGAFELYHVQGGGALAGSSVAAVGNNLQVSGFGYFSETSTEQMAMEQANVSPGSNAYWLYTYNPAASSYASAGPSGTIGSNLTVVGVADLLGNGSSELIMEQANVTPGTNAYWAYMYNPSNNTFDAIGNKALGTVGNNFNVVGFGPLGTAGQDEMLMQDAAGDFEVYQYRTSENAFVGTSMGSVGAPWVLDGIVDPPNGVAGAASSGQLVQAMASMGGGAAVSTATNPPIGAESSQPTILLTTPQPA